jgi:hypothetical protein
VTIEEKTATARAITGPSQPARRRHLRRKPAAPVTTTPKPSDYFGHIVQWDGDTKAQKTAWLVGPDGKRRWIPTTDVYWCPEETRAIPARTYSRRRCRPAP